jgi:parallel beta-helix repeat protein
MLRAGALTVLALSMASPAAATCDATGAVLIGQGMVPFTITQPGRYVVTENLTTAASAAVITIASSTGDIDLCLGGFQIFQQLFDPAIEGQYFGGNVSIHEGVLLGAAGIELGLTSPGTVRIEDVVIRPFLGGSGLSVAGARSVTVRRSVILPTGGTTLIDVDGGGITDVAIEDSQFADFQEQAIDVDGAAAVAIRRNLFHGEITGSPVQEGLQAVRVRNSGACEISGNEVGGTPGGVRGIRVQNSRGCTITGNALNSIIGAGIELLDVQGARVSGNTVRGAQSGILVDGASSGNRIEGNTVEGSGQHGLVVRGDRNEIRDNLLTGNGCYGLLLDDSGADVPQDNLLRGNTARGNAGACGSCSSVFSTDFCWGDMSSNTSHGDNYLPGQI